MMTGTDRFEMFFKKINFLIGSLIPLILIIVITLMYYFPEVLGRQAESINIGTTLFFILMQAIMLGICIVNTVMLLRKSPAIIIDAYGITHNTSVWGSIEVKWSDIIRPTLKISGKYKYLLLQVHHPADFINQATNLPMRLALQLNQKLQKTPIVLQLYAVGGDLELLQNVIETELDQRRLSNMRP